MSEAREEARGPAVMAGSAPLTTGERYRAAVAGLAPVLLGLLVLAPFAVWGGAGVAEVVAAAVVYGGLLGLASGFVYVDRVHARQCPRCSTRSPRGTERCPSCDYDLAERPRYACEHRHRVYVEPGLCDCGRRLRRLEIARGLRRELVFALRLSAWLVVFLGGMALLLNIVGPS